MGITPVRSDGRRFGARALALTSLTILVLSGCTAAESGAATPNEQKYGGLSFVEAMPQCLTERGWPTEGVGDDGLRTEVSQEQRDTFDAARGECLVETGYYQEVEPLTEVGVAEWYEALVLTAACLEGLGFTIDDAPTKQTFIDSYFGDPASTWNPYPEPSSLANWAEIEEACPQPGLEGEPVQTFERSISNAIH